MRFIRSRFVALLVAVSAIFGFSPLANHSLAAVKVAGIFTSNMVLQRDLPLPVWGTADNGEQVKVSIGDQKVETTAEAGHWRVNLQPLKAGGEVLELRIAGPKNEITLKNVIV